MQDVEYAFNNYMKACIRHFKITDECEQIQQTNSSMESVNESVEEEPDDLKEKPNDTKEEIKEDSKDVSMLKSIKFPNGTLDGFVNYQI
jgi:hypothetical protein